MKRTILILGVFFLSTGLASIFWPPATAQADMIGAGPGDGPPTFTEYEGDEQGWIVSDEGWVVTDPNSPDGGQPVYFDPDKGPWVKELRQPAGVEGKEYELLEILTVSAGPDPANPAPGWWDYHQTIETIGWTWSSIETWDAVVDAIRWQLTAEEGGKRADWQFPSELPVGTEIIFRKHVTFDPNIGDPAAPLVISQYPTIPEPGTLMLVATGLLTMLGCAWRRRKRAA